MCFPDLWEYSAFAPLLMPHPGFPTPAHQQPTGICDPAEQICRDLGIAQPENMRRVTKTDGKAGKTARIEGMQEETWGITHICLLMFLHQKYQGSPRNEEGPELPSPSAFPRVGFSLCDLQSLSLMEATWPRPFVPPEIGTR